MTRRTISSLSILALLALSLLACEGGDDGTSSTGGTGHLAVQLTDAPLDIDTVQNVFVTISGLKVFPAEGDSGQIELMSRAETFDLLTLTDGVTTMLADGDLAAGLYKKIRLEVSDANLVFKDQTQVDLKLDSGKVDINLPFEIATSETLVVTLDFDAAASLHVVKAGSSGQYILRPVVNADKSTDPAPTPLPPPPPPPDPNMPPPDPNMP